MKTTSYTCEELRAKGVDTSKLQFPGVLNYIVQASIDRETGDIQYDQYQPRKNRIWTGVNDMTEDELKREMAQTIERMKIAMILMQDFIDGKSDSFYYWEASDEYEFYNK